MNVVIYARYSSHSQTEQSIEGQLHDCYEYAAREGYTVIAEYIDRAQSGRTDNRDDFQRMISDAAKKQFDLVIVWKLDRFARNRYDSAINKAKLKKYGVRVVSVKENITDTPEGIILEGMLESMAEYYSANLSVNVKRGQRETVAKGKFCGGCIPYGYKSVNGKLVADERTAPVIRYVFEQYASGVSKRQIIDTLNAKGVKSAFGHKLGISSFQHALTSPTYTGHFTYLGKEVEGCCEALIDQDTFDKVQTRLRRVSRAPSASKAAVDYMLQGKAFCGHCASPMVGESGRGKGGTVYYYYACAEKKKRHICDKHNEKKDLVEQFVVRCTVEYVLTPHRIPQIAQSIVAEYDKEFNSSRVSELERAAQRIERELNALVDALIDAPKVAQKRIYEKMETLEVQKGDIEADLAKLRIAAGIRYTESEVTAWLKQFCNGDSLDPEFCKRIIDVFINSVYLYDDRIVIFYNIRGGKQVAHKDVTAALESLPTAPPSKCSDLNVLAPPKTRSVGTGLLCC